MFEFTRRALLETSVGLAVVPSIGATTGDIPAPFDQMPVREDPTERTRGLAEVFYPPRAVPERGAIPDHRHQHVVTREITLPAWALEGARWRISERHDPDRQFVEEVLQEYAYISERFLTPDGHDAVGVLLEHAERGGGDADD